MTRLALVPIALALLAAGCGSSSKPSAVPAATHTRSTAPSATTTVAPGGALQAEANAAATGDIPDNQVFLVFRNSTSGYSMKYPEGWAQQGSGARVTFRDKNNIVRIVVARRARPTASSVRADLQRLGVRIERAPQSTNVGGRPAIKAVYSTESAPNPVTGKRVKLVVDRYYFWQAGRLAVVDLGTPAGVDNVDAYRLMSESFRWS
jgi:hypothetical protein